MDSVIILSDGESSDDDSVVSIVTKKATEVLKVPNSPAVLEEDIVVTFSRRADTLPHARYDCSTHPFMSTDIAEAPMYSNALICDQCYCYVCDKPATQCSSWSVMGVMCHCNAHKKSIFWKNQRERAVLGYLRHFHLNLHEIDTDLRLAETYLLQFETMLLAVHSSFMIGSTLPCFCHCHKSTKALACKICQHYRVHDYSPVYQCVLTFLDTADRQKPKAAAVMRLGAAKAFLSQCRPPGNMKQEPPAANIDAARFLLLERVTEAVVRQLVVCDFSAEFIQKLQIFYQNTRLPLQCATLANSLKVRLWNDPLLASVLRGQNVSGFVKHGKRGAKDILIEPAAVVQHRVHTLERQHRYRELTRYLRVVQAPNGQHNKEVRDFIPFYQCKDGDLNTAMTSFFTTPFSWLPCHLTPHLFMNYLRIFATATAPTDTASMTTHPFSHTAPWEPIEGAAKVCGLAIAKFALRVQHCNKEVNADSQCWAYLLHILSCPSGLRPHTSDCESLPEPTPAFLQEAIGITTDILSTPVPNIPRSYLKDYPDQALLLLVTKALACRALACPPSPLLLILRKYKENMWCLRWLFECLSSPEPFRGFLKDLTRELSEAQRDDHSYCTLPTEISLIQFVADLRVIIKDHERNLHSHSVTDVDSHHGEPGDHLKNNEDKDADLENGDAPGRTTRNQKEPLPMQHPHLLSSDPRPFGLWRGRCMQLLEYILSCEESEPFRNPKALETFLDCPRIVDSPMDLGTVKNMLASGKYNTPIEFCKDVRLVFSNAIAQNPDKTSKIYLKTVCVSALFEAHAHYILTKYQYVLTDRLTTQGAATKVGQAADEQMQHAMECSDSSSRPERKRCAEAETSSPFLPAPPSSKQRPPLLNSKDDTQAASHAHSREPSRLVVRLERLEGDLLSTTSVVVTPAGCARRPRGRPRKQQDVTTAKIASPAPIPMGCARRPRGRSRKQQDVTTAKIASPAPKLAETPTAEVATTVVANPAQLAEIPIAEVATIEVANPAQKLKKYPKRRKAVLAETSTAEVATTEVGSPAQLAETPTAEVATTDPPASQYPKRRQKVSLKQ